MSGYRTDRTFGYEPRKHAEPTPWPHHWFLTLFLFIVALLFLTHMGHGAVSNIIHANITAPKGW